MAFFQDIKTDFDDFWRRANTSWGPFVRNASVSLDAYAGKTWRFDERKALLDEGRDPQEFNIIRPEINLFSGYLRDNIKSTIVGPVEGSDQKTADQLTEVIKYVYEKAQGNDVFLNAADHSMITGSALVGLYLDFSRDPEHGDIKFYRRSYASFIIDPDFNNQDLSDASEIAMRDFVTREDAKALLPFVDPKTIDDLPAFVEDDKFRQLRQRGSTFTKRADLLSYDSYYRRVTRDVNEIVDMDTGATIPLFGDAEELDLMQDKVAFAQEMMGANVEIIKRPKQLVELNILLSGEPVYSGPDPLGLETYPFVWLPCYWHPELDDYGIKLQGLAYGLVDAQRAFNRRMVRKQDVMDSVVNTGYFYKIDKVHDARMLLQSGSGKMIPMTEDADLDRDIKPVNQGAIPPGWQEETAFIQNLTLRIAGVNESLMGMDEGGNTQVSGTLAQVRTANGLRANRALFDNFERAQKQLGALVVKAIQKNYPVGKIRRILNEEPTEQFADGNFDRFDAVMKQGVLSQTQRDAFYFELLNLMDRGFNIPQSLILRNLPIAGASDVIEALEEQEQQAQQQAQIEAEDKRRRDALIDAETEQKIALAQERRARVLSDIGLARSRITESIENRQDAVLARAKAFTELEKLNTEKLQGLVDLVQTFEDIFSAKEEQALSTDVARQEQLKDSPQQESQAQGLDLSQLQQQQGGIQDGSI